MKGKFDNQIVGFICGMIGPLIGGFLYYLMLFRHLALQEYIQMMINSDSVAPIISISAVFNLLVFFVFIWLKMDRSARGVILATFMYVLAVVLIKYV